MGFPGLKPINSQTAIYPRRSTYWCAKGMIYLSVTREREEERERKREEEREAERAPHTRIGTVAMCNVGKCPSNRNAMRWRFQMLWAWVRVADVNRG